MSVQFYPNGIGGTAPGDSLDLARPLQITGNIWYVSSLIGTDAASPAGQNRESPLATANQAITNAVDGDIIVFLAGHTETITAAIAVGKSLTFVGEGTTSGKPAVSFRCNSAASSVFSMTVAFVEFRNIYFPPNAQVNAGTKLNYSTNAATDGVVRGCYFEQGATDTGYGLGFNAGNRARIEGCTFISVATSTAAQPLGALRTSSGVVGMTIRDTVVSAGAFGYSSGTAAVNLATGVSNLVVEGLSLLLGADASFGSGVTTGRINIQTSTGGSRVNWS